MSLILNVTRFITDPLTLDLAGTQDTVLTFTFESGGLVGVYYKIHVSKQYCYLRTIFNCNEIVNSQSQRTRRR